MAADDEDRATTPSACDRFVTVVPGGTRAPALARTRFSGWLNGQLSPAGRDDALLLLSELVTNSVRHAEAAPASDVRITAEVRGEVLRLEVADAGTDPGFTRRAPDLDHGGGFGLHLVEQIALRWGVARTGGTVVWCELALG